MSDCVVLRAMVLELVWLIVAVVEIVLLELGGIIVVGVVVGASCWKMLIVVSSVDSGCENECS